MRGLVLVTLLSLVACSKKASAPSCEQVADKMLALTKSPASKDGLVAECHARKVSPAQRKCMVDAKDIGELAGCVGKRKMTRTEENPPPIPDQPDPHTGIKKDMFPPNDPHNLPLTPNKIESGSGSATP